MTDRRPECQWTRSLELVPPRSSSSGSQWAICGRIPKFTPLAKTTLDASSSVLSAAVPNTRRRRTADSLRGAPIDPLLDIQNLLLFPLRRLVHFLNVGVGHLLDVLQRAALLVLADGLVLEQLLQVLVGVAADVAHRHA